MEKRIKKRYIFLVFILLMGMIAFLYITKSPFTKEDKKFSIDNILLKSSIKEGSNLSKLLKITSYTEGYFKIEKNNLDFVSISEERFNMKKGEERTIEINFNMENKKAGVYFGNLVISEEEESLTIPIIIEIETKEVLFDGRINVPLEYLDVLPGENTVIEHTIFNLENIGIQNVEISYLMTDFNGRIFFSDKENIGIETPTLNTKVIPIPEDADYGDYLFTSIVEYENSIGTSSHFFKISKNKVNIINDGFFTWVIILSLIVLIFFIIFYNMQRDKVLLRLQKEYQLEINKRLLIITKKKRATKKLSPKRKKEISQKIRENHAEEIKRIKKVYNQRIKTIKQLQQNSNKNNIEKKLTQWKKQGYNTNEFLIEPKEEGLKEKTKKYKEDGYNL